ncbi:hypothetical protein WN944_026552 [Citrus x changshan-huyou]|uniref:Cyclin-dependent kinase inhibitor domain-containing protein n=1 Tax=Citrus x changshan-huyou TaxID=2935761 RepID=A0AAP0LWG7_9ROSI
MGKYMRKAKTAAGEVAVMEVTQSSPLGVRTRAKTLALQKATSAGAGGSGSYLQLRSRRLEKPAALVNETSGRRRRRRKENSRARERSRGKKNVDEVEEEKETDDVAAAAVEVEEEEENGNKNLDIEASFGENALESEARERGTRESTPCSLIRDPEIIRTPGSSNRPTSSMQNREAQISACSLIPTAHEIDKFFADTEEEQQRQFIEKYNYDPVNDKPLPGHFKWQKVDP